MSEESADNFPGSRPQVALFDPWMQLFASNNNRGSFFKGLEGTVSSADLIEAGAPTKEVKRKAA